MCKPSMTFQVLGQPLIIGDVFEKDLSLESFTVEEDDESEGGEGQESAEESRDGDDRHTKARQRDVEL